MRKGIVRGVFEAPRKGLVNSWVLPAPLWSAGGSSPGVRRGSALVAPRGWNHGVTAGGAGPDELDRVLRSIDSDK